MAASVEHRTANGASRGSTMKFGNPSSSSAAHMVSTVNLLKQRCAMELGSAMANNVLSSFSRLMEWISNERLRRLPTEGSAWDKVLGWAQSFAEKFNDFDLAIEQFTGGQYDGAEIAFGYCILLLELGEDNAPALQTSFGFFFQRAIDLIALLNRVELFNASSQITDELVLAYADLVTLVSDIALKFYQAIRSDRETSVDIYSEFSTPIQSFQERRTKTVESMWSYQLSRDGIDTTRIANINELRAWLDVDDYVLRYKTGDYTSLVTERHALTCLWLAPYLTRFLNGNQDSLIITGAIGTGKSVLAGTIVDTLQKTATRRSYSVIFISIDARIKPYATSLYVAHKLLFQFLELRVGNVEVYKIIADAFEASQKLRDIKAYESRIWVAIEKLVEVTLPASKDTIIVIDGVDEVSEDPKEGQALLKHLKDVSTKHDKVKLITLSQPSALVPETKADVEITPDLVYDDVFAVVSDLMERSPHYNSQPWTQQNMSVDSVVDAAKGSFMWAKMVTKTLVMENTPEKFTGAIAALKKSPKSIPDLTKELLTTSNLSEEGKILVLWLALSQRPLTPDELAWVHASDPTTGTVSESKPNVLRLLQPAAQLVILHNGLLYLRHTVIKRTLMTWFDQNKPVKEPHQELTLRLLTYFKNIIREQKEPSFTSLDQSYVDQKFHDNDLIEYVVRYWPTHYLGLSPKVREINPDFRKELVNVIPTSPSAPLIEKTSWMWIPTPDRISWHTATIDLRRKVLNDHPVVLQSIIDLASILQQLGDYEMSATYFHSAFQMSTKIFSSTHPVTINCANHFLEVTQGIKVTSRTQIVSLREEVLLVLIETYKKQYGVTSERVMSLRTQLVELYRTVKEEQKAISIEQEVSGGTAQESTTSGSKRTRPGSLGVRLKSGRVKDFDVSEWDFDESKGHDVLIKVDWSNRINELLQLAKQHAAKGEVAMAEQCYVDAWYRMSQQTRSTNTTIDGHERKISLAIAMADFYKSVKRESEASAILTGVWEEYRSLSSSRTQKINSKFVEIAKLMKSLELTATSLEVFKHTSSVYRSLDMTNTSTYKEVQELEQSTHRELVQKASSSSGYSSQVSESVVTEIFTYMNASNSTQLEATSVNAIRQVVSTFITQHRYKDATTTIKRTLRALWSSLFSALAEDVGQPSSNPDFAIELVEQLITCYKSRHRLMKALEYREKLYHSFKLSRKVDDKLLQHSISDLFTLYEQMRAPDKITQLHRELLEDYKKIYGSSHPKVVETLFTLARITAPEPVSAEYYRQIVTILCKDSDVCHPDAVSPLITVAAHYWNERRYPGAIWAYSLLFRTFTRKGKELKAFHDQTLVWTIYNRYVASLRATTTDITTIYDITTQYRKACTEVFGADHEITIDATMYLARVCDSSKRYQLQAISLYEELTKNTKASKYHGEIKQTLDAIYEEQSLEAVRSTTVSASSEQINRAVTVIRQRMQKTRSEFGWSHEESLDQLKEVTQLYAKQSKKEEAVKELHEATRQIITNEKSSVGLTRAASTVAASYNTINETHRGLEIAEEMRWQLITKDTSNSKKYNIDVSSSSRSVAIYVAQLEYSLRQDTSTSFNEIYLTIVTEMVYYEDFQRSIRNNSSIEVVFSAASRLHSFLSLHQRSVIKGQVISELVSYFIRISGQNAKIGDVSQVKVLVTTMLEYIETHEVKNFNHSVLVASIEYVRKYLADGRSKEACDLAQTSFRYVDAVGGFKSQTAIKYGLILAIAISNLDVAKSSSSQDQTRIAGEIVHQVLRTAKEIDMNPAGIPLHQTNMFITILGEQKDYATLEWFITILWEAREAHRNWSPAVVLELGYRLVLARFLLNKHDLALQLAADIAYNLRRVYGSTHLATLEVNVLFSQLCISTGLAFQAQKGAEGIARRYYKRAIGIHEGVLRSLTVDPLGLGEDDDITVLSTEPEPMDLSVVVNTDATQGTYARKHLELLKLALQRFGGYPKGHGEYEAINADIFRAFPEELRGFEGLEKWNVEKFGNGKADGNAGALDTDIKRWSLSSAVNGNAGSGTHPTAVMDGMSNGNTTVQRH